MENICNRIKEIINSKGVTTARFAEIIGVKQSTLSHTLNGRNKPSLDILMSISAAFPEISLDWLTKSKGQMFDSTLGNDVNKSLVSITDATNQTEIDSENLFSSKSSAIEGNSPNGLNGNSISVNSINSITEDKSVNSENGDMSFLWDVALYAQFPYPAEFENLPPISSIPSDGRNTTGRYPKKRKITEVRIFFDDNTFESFSPNILGDTDK